MLEIWCQIQLKWFSHLQDAQERKISHLQNAQDLVPGPRLQRSLDGLPLKENLNFLMVDPRDDLVSG